MSDDKEVNIKFGADSNGLKRGAEEATAAVQTATNQMESGLRRLSAEAAASVKSIQHEIHSQFSAIEGAMHKVSSAFMAMTAIVAGGAAFKEIIDSTVRWRSEALKLARTLGTTTEEASVLMVALDHIGVTQEQFESGAKMMTRSLRTSEQAFRDLGIETRDAQGHYRGMNEIMIETNERLARIKEGTDRNVAGQQVYGRAWFEIQKIVKLNAETMKEAEERARELGLKVGPEAAAELAGYKLQMRELKLTLEAVMMQVGNALMPVLVQLGAWFNSIGPQAVEAFGMAIKGVTALIEYFVLGVITIAESLKGVGQQIGIFAATAAEVWDRIFRGDFKGAAAAAKQGWSDISKAGEDAMNRIATAAVKTNESVGKMLGLIPVKPRKAKEEPRTGEAYDGPQKEEKTRTADWKSDLEAQKEAEQAFFKDYLAVEIEFWEQKSILTKRGTKEDREVRHELYQLHKQQAQQSLAEEIAGLKLSQEEALKTGYRRIEIEDQIAGKIKEKYGEDSKEYKAVLRDKAKLQKEYEQESLKSIEAYLEKEKELSLVSKEMEQEALNFKKEIGQISAVEELEATKKLEEEKFQIELDYAKDRATILPEGPEKEKALNDIEVMTAKHGQKIQQINHQTTLAVKSSWDSIFSAITSAVETSIKGMIMGTTTLRKAVANLAQSILAEFVSLGVKRAAAWAASELAMTGATASGVASRVALESWAAVTSVALAAWSAIKKIAIYAWEAAAAVYAALAEIPIVGPVIAPVAAVAALVTITGFAANIASAAGGWEVPSDQIAQVHKNEMVLPAHLSDRIRNMTEPGGQGFNIHYAPKVQALDARGVQDVLDTHSRHIVKLVQKELRNHPY